jgi:hypothetical protein
MKNIPSDILIENFFNPATSFSHVSHLHRETEKDFSFVSQNWTNLKMELKPMRYDDKRVYWHFRRMEDILSAIGK